MAADNSENEEAECHVDWGTGYIMAALFVWPLAILIFLCEIVWPPGCAIIAVLIILGLYVLCHWIDTKAPVSKSALGFIVLGYMIVHALAFGASFAVGFFIKAKMWQAMIAFGFSVISFIVTGHFIMHKTKKRSDKNSDSRTAGAKKYTSYSQGRAKRMSTSHSDSDINGIDVDVESHDSGPRCSPRCSPPAPRSPPSPASYGGSFGGGSCGGGSGGGSGGGCSD